MGLRFRKSINLGGGARINVSRRGIGGSVGTKGYRVTKKSGGGIRRTANIPGTGISYVSEGSSGAPTTNQTSSGGILKMLFYLLFWPILILAWPFKLISKR